MPFVPLFTCGDYTLSRRYASTVFSIGPPNSQTLGILAWLPVAASRARICWRIKRAIRAFFSLIPLISVSYRIYGNHGNRPRYSLTAQRFIPVAGIGNIAATTATKTGPSGCRTMENGNHGNQDKSALLGHALKAPLHPVGAAFLLFGNLPPAGHIPHDSP